MIKDKWDKWLLIIFSCNAPYIKSQCNVKKNSWCYKLPRLCINNSDMYRLNNIWEINKKYNYAEKPKKLSYIPTSWQRVEKPEAKSPTKAFQFHSSIILWMLLTSHYSLTSNWKLLSQSKDIVFPYVWPFFMGTELYNVNNYFDVGCNFSPLKCCLKCWNK